jgi:hypothetical protein
MMGYRHVISLTASGEISELFYGAKGRGSSVLANIPGARHVCGFWGASRHAIVSTDDGSVFDVFYGGKHGKGTTRLSIFDNGIVDIAGFYSLNDYKCHVLVATPNGKIADIYYEDGSSSISIASIAVVPNPDLMNQNIGKPVCLAAYDAEGAYSRVLVANPREIWEVYFGPYLKTLYTRISTPGQVSGLGGFYSTDDRTSHAIYLSPSGGVTELFYKSEQNP